MNPSKSIKLKTKAFPSTWHKVLWTAMVLLLATALFFIYGVIPDQVARGLVQAALQQNVPVKNPGQFGLKYQDVEFKTTDGINLKGWWIPASIRRPLGTVILTHGVFHNRDQILTRAVFLQEAGYQVLAMDLRGHGESGPAPLSGGLLESGDFRAAADFLRQKKWIQPPLVFFGFSLGAICALRAGADTPVDAVIADSPMPNVKSYISGRTLAAPFAFLPGLISRCIQAYDSVTGLHLGETDLDLMPVVRHIQAIPVLFFSGEKDDLVKSGEVQKLFDQCPAPHRRLVFIPEAGHEQTYTQYPVIYEKSVLDFLTDVREGFPKRVDSAWAISPSKELNKAVQTPGFLKAPAAVTQHNQ